MIWLVSILAGLATLSLVNVAGDRASRAIQAGPLAWLDSMLGIGAGAAMGIATASLLVLMAVRLPLGHAVEHELVRARSPRPLLAGGVTACQLAAGYPGAHGLEHEYAFARRLLGRATPAI